MEASCCEDDLTGTSNLTRHRCSLTAEHSSPLHLLKNDECQWKTLPKFKYAIKLKCMSSISVLISELHVFCFLFFIIIILYFIFIKMAPGPSKG